MILRSGLLLLCVVSPALFGQTVTVDGYPYAGSSPAQERRDFTFAYSDSAGTSHLDVTSVHI